MSLNIVILRRTSKRVKFYNKTFNKGYSVKNFTQKNNIALENNLKPIPI